MEQKNIILSAKGLTKNFGETSVLTDINIDIERGSFTVIMGPSGSGKSTLLYCLSGMDGITEGTLIYQGQEITHLSEVEQTRLRGNEFGFVFQSSRLVKNLTLYENVLVGGLLQDGHSEENVREKTDALLKEMGLYRAKDRFPSVVSGGEAQRAAVARAVIKNPSILFADEPTGALNKANSMEVLKLIAGQQKKGRTILLVTHDREAALYGNQILYLEDGRIKDSLKLPAYGGKEEEREHLFSDWLEKQRW